MSADYWLDELAKNGDGDLVTTLRAVLPSQFNAILTAQIDAVSAERQRLALIHWTVRTVAEDKRHDYLLRKEACLRQLMYPIALKMHNGD